MTMNQREKLVIFLLIKKAIMDYFLGNIIVQEVLDNENTDNMINIKLNTHIISSRQKLYSKISHLLQMAGNCLIFIYFQFHLSEIY